MFHCNTIKPINEKEIDNSYTDIEKKMLKVEICKEKFLYCNLRCDQSF